MRKQNLPHTSTPSAHIIPGLFIAHDNEGRPISGILPGQGSVKAVIKNVLSMSNEKSFIGEAQVHIDSKNRFRIPEKIINYIAYIKHKLNIIEPIGFIFIKGEGNNTIHMRLANTNEPSTETIHYPDSGNRICLGPNLIKHINTKTPFIGIRTGSLGLEIIIGINIQQAHRPFYRGPLVAIWPIDNDGKKAIDDFFPSGNTITNGTIDKGRISISKLLQRLKSMTGQGDNIDLFISRSDKEGELLLETNLCYDSHNIRQRRVKIDTNNRISLEAIELEWLSKTNTVEIIRNPDSPFGFIIKGVQSNT